MNALNRIRIILFALMIFGAFANFAQNEWGNAIIVWCEFFMALTFFWAMAAIFFKNKKTAYRKKLNTFQLYITGAIVMGFVGVILTSLIFPKPLLPFIWLLAVAFLMLPLTIIPEAIFDLFKRTPTRFVYENYFLFIFFLALVFKNLAYPFTTILIMVSSFFLLLYFITSTIKFFRANYRSGKMLVTVLTVGSLAAILFSLTVLAKVMRYPFMMATLYAATALLVLMIIGFAKWTYDFNGRRINMLEGLRLFKTNIVLIFFMALVYCGYYYLSAKDLAPRFYSTDFPQSYYRFRNAGNYEQMTLVRDIYAAFTDHTKKNGFIK